MRSPYLNPATDPFTQDCGQPFISYHGVDGDADKPPYALRDNLVKLVTNHPAVLMIVPGSRTSKTDNEFPSQERFVLLHVPANAHFVYEYSQGEGGHVSESLQCASPSYFEEHSPEASLTIVLGKSDVTEGGRFFRTSLESMKGLHFA